MKMKRRSLLAGAGTAAAAAMLPIPATFAAPAGLVDVHHHHVPPIYIELSEAFAKRTGFPILPPVRDWTPERSLAAMDANGVASSVLVLAQSPGVWDFSDSALLRRLARASNEHGAALARAHPGRYSFFAWLPMPDVEGSLAEIAYGLDVLGASGIGFFTSFGKQWPGEKTFEPIWDELDRRGAIAYFHPLAPACCANLLPGVPDNYIEFPQDTARAVMSLLFNGTLARHRRVRWIFSHAGGSVPVFAARVTTLAKGTNIAAAAPDGIMAEIARLYFETANANYPASIDALLDVVPSSHVFFGTDYPYVSVTDNTAAFKSLKLAPAVRAAIASSNARTLIPHLA
jgi:predicted TIM-barrel fold metal-dependent hydrolase